MKKLLLVIAAGVAGISFAQTSLYSNDFEGAPGFNINTTDMGGSTTAENPWVVNNIYAGGTSTFMCLGFPINFTVPAAAQQPAGITNNPTSQHLHVTPQIAIDAGGSMPAASYVAYDGICMFGNQSTFSAMSTDFSTVGYDSIAVDLWWMCGGSQYYYGEMYYSTDGGTSWNALDCPTTGTIEWRNQTNWINQATSDAGLAGQSTVRLGFRFVSGTNSTGALDPGFAIDDIEVFGYTLCQETASAITESACDSYISPSGSYTWTVSGMYNDTIPNVAGCDSVITVDLTINTVDNAVTQSGTALTADQSGATYQWLDCDNGNATIAGATSQTYVATMNGNYAVEVTINGCTDTSTCYSVAGIGFEENVFGDAIKLYPNPTDGEVFIEVDPSFDMVEVEIKNIEGKLVSKQVYTNSELIRLNITGESGIYLIEIKAAGKLQHYRVIKH